MREDFNFEEDIVKFYQKIVAYEKTFGDLELEKSIHSNLVRLQADLETFRKILAGLWNNLHQQGNLLARDPEKNFQSLKTKIAEEEKTLKEEYGFLLKERAEAKIIAKEEKKEEKTEVIEKNIKKILRESSYLVASSLYPVKSTSGYGLVKYRNFDRATAQAFLDTYAHDPRTAKAHPHKFSVKIGSHDPDWSYLVMIAKGGSDAGGRPGQATTIIVFFSKTHENYLRRIADTHPRVLTNTLIASCLGMKAKYVFDIIGRKQKPTIL